jgi:hypothetical protein
MPRLVQTAASSPLSIKVRPRASVMQYTSKARKAVPAPVNNVIFLLISIYGYRKLNNTMHMIS